MPDILNLISDAGTFVCGRFCHAAVSTCRRAAVLDLTENRYQLLRENNPYAEVPFEGSCDELLDRFIAIVHPDDRERLQHLLSRGNLLSALASGQNELWGEGRLLVNGVSCRTGVCTLRAEAKAGGHLLAIVLFYDFDGNEAEERLRAELTIVGSELESKHYYQKMINASVPMEAILYRLSGGPPSYMFGALLHQLGYTEEDFITFHRAGLRGLIHPEDYTRAQTYARAAAAARTPYYEQEFRVLMKNGGIVWIFEKTALTKDADGEPAYLGVYIDITDRKAAEETLRIREEELRVAMSQMGHRYCRYDVIARTLSLPPQYASTHGLPEMLVNFPQEPDPLPETLREYASLCKRILQGERAGSVVVCIRNIDGSYRWEKAEFAAVCDSKGNTVCAVISIDDITEEKTNMLEMLHRANSDGMTGLLNKAAAEELVNQWLIREEGAPCAMLVVDLDDLKAVNDTLGHCQGDRALTLLADTLRNHFRSTDLIGRVGGDEFIVFLPGLSNETRLRESLFALVRRLSALCVGEKNDYPFHASIGVALGKGGADDYSALFRKADSALYCVKRNGKNDFAIYGTKENTDKAGTGRAAPC